MIVEREQILRLTAVEVGKATGLFLQQWLERAGDQLGILEGELFLLDAGDTAAVETVDPANWTDWLAGVWGMRGISIETESHGLPTEVLFPDGRSAMVKVESLMASRFLTSGEPLDLGESESRGNVYTESAAFTICCAYVRWTGFNQYSTIAGLLETLQAIQKGEPAGIANSSWSELLGGPTLS